MTEPIEVQACPFCGSFEITRNLVEWEAQSMDSCDRRNVAILSEHQCKGCCRSFWS